MKTEKACTRCNVLKPVDAFYLVKHYVNGRYYRQSQCRDCDNIRRKQQNDANKDRNKWRNIQKVYGLTQADWQKLFDSQGAVCGCCGSPDPGWDRGWLVDHCHATGRVRGILCTNCNLLIGHADDKPETLRKAAEYLERT